MPKVEFRPNPDGYAFESNWTYDQTEIDTIRNILTGVLMPIALALGPIELGGIIALKVALQNILPNEKYGLCGGMAASARNYWKLQLVVPRGARQDD